MIACFLLGVIFTFCVVCTFTVAMMFVHSAIFAMLLISNASAFTGWNVHRGRARLLGLHLGSSSNEPPSPITEGMDPSLDALFEQISDMDPNDVPPELQRAIQEKIDQGAPPDWKIRLQIMGFTPLTIAGYGVAFVLIALNTMLGTGWASTMLGFDEPPLTMDTYSIGKDTDISMLPGNRRQAIDDAIKANIEEIRLKRPTQNDVR
jgi:hypothetical protein